MAQSVRPYAVFLGCTEAHVVVLDYPSPHAEPCLDARATRKAWPVPFPISGCAAVAVLVAFRDRLD
ncbi:MAG: hypothetical protein AAGL49_09020 [Pseudomonadota bacterium]